MLAVAIISENDSELMDHFGLHYSTFVLLVTRLCRPYQLLIQIAIVLANRSPFLIREGKGKVKCCLF